MGYSGAGAKLIHEKNQEQKISWHCPFKDILLEMFHAQSHHRRSSEEAF